MGGNLIPRKIYYLTKYTANETWERDEKFERLINEAETAQRLSLGARKRNENILS
jgi:hypothetical protein